MNQISLSAVTESYGRTTETMTSLEISELTGKRHDNVMADIRKMLAELHGDGGVLIFQDTHTNTQNGQSYSIFKLPKRESLILVSGYSVTMRAKIIDRWDELETGRAIPAMAQPQQTIEADKPDPQAFAVVQSAWVDAVERKIASKREALQFLRDASAVMIHGVDVLQRAAKARNPAKSLPAPTQATLTNGESVPYGFRAAGTKSATDLLRDHGVSAQAKALYDAMEKQNIVTTRYDLTVDQPGFRVLIGEGLQYGQNVMLFESVRSNPYFYPDRFGALLKRVWLLVDATPKPTAAERALYDYKNIVQEAWNVYGRDTIAVEGCEHPVPYVSRAALVQYLVDSLGKTEKRVCNMIAPRGDMTRALVQDGFVRPHNHGWLILYGVKIEAEKEKILPPWMLNK